MGCVAALGSAALVKTKYFRSAHTPLESSLVVLIAYGSYVLADGLGLSGIVTVLSCGVFMARYVKPNLTPASKDRVCEGGQGGKVHCVLACAFLPAALLPCGHCCCFAAWRLQVGAFFKLTSMLVRGAKALVRRALPAQLLGTSTERHCKVYHCP